MLSGVSVLSDDTPALMPAPDASDSPPALEARCHSVHIRFAPSQGRRLTRPTSVPNDRSLWTERPVLMERAGATVTGPARLRRRAAAEARRIWKQYEDA